MHMRFAFITTGGPPRKRVYMIALLSSLSLSLSLSLSPSLSLSLSVPHSLCFAYSSFFALSIFGVAAGQEIIFATSPSFRLHCSPLPSLCLSYLHSSLPLPLALPDYLPQPCDNKLRGRRCSLVAHRSVWLCFGVALLLSLPPRDSEKFVNCRIN
jgi:hypothetical protein